MKSEKAKKIMIRLSETVYKKIEELAKQDNRLPGPYLSIKLSKEFGEQHPIPSRDWPITYSGI